MDRFYLSHALPARPSAPPVPGAAPLPARSVLARLAALMLCGVPLAVLAQADPADPAAETPPVLRPTGRLHDALPGSVRAQLPVFVRGDRVTGQPDIRAVIEGDAELRRGDTVIRADRMEYDVATDRAKASGNVHINRAGNVYDGSLLDMQVEAFSGFFSDTRYRFLETSAHGEASRVDFIDRERSVVHDATYTTCQRTDEASWQPDWIIRAKKIHLDRVEDVGRAEDGVLEFKGVPVLPVPYLTFPLSDRRKSGFLPPTIGLDSLSGLEYAQPYYWNIAPNRDATITPVLLSRRGVMLSGEFRYLEPRYSGEITGEFMPGDRLRDRDRWSYGIQHRGALGTPLGDASLGINVRRVSDDDYWRDFSQRLLGRGSLPDTVNNQLAQRLLPGEVSLNWGRNDHTLSLRTVKWQTLQDVNSPIVPPYDRQPQLRWQYQPAQLAGGFDASIEADYTSFHADRAYTGQPNAKRSYALAQVSRPFLAPAGFITPRVQLHTTHYEFDAPLVGGQRTASRTLPTFSLDSGLVFERDAAYFGRGFVQTLEPRAFYTYTPYRNQSMLPVYDTAANDFNFASIYSENAFGGNDRVADNNLLTLGVTTRLLDPETGAEAARFGVAQRLRFADQQVTMPGAAPVSERLSDVLLGAGINWTPQWGFDSTVQYNPKSGRSLRTTVGARYSPGDYRTVSAAYRMQKVTGLISEPSEQIDVGWQWPLNDVLGSGKPGAGGRWYSVGRLNYSLEDRKLVDTVVGFEYESCCWIGRVVLERLQRSVNASNTRLMFQIEFVGFSRLSLGANPLSSLKQNVPRYQFLRENQTPPSRFSNYD
ncbi:LPS-assembly protein LptD [Diaphorobacter sp.]|uniref:LPS-assembly protein LptD n=1 Tax=Diaphorobacter sp. TaxID=1934310 RepID=UPI003D11A081